MKSHCYPFRQIPHSSKLFLDYLDFLPSVQQFYSRSPRFLEWAKDEAASIQYPAERRAQVAAVLERQNKGWGAGAKTLENLDRFRSGACALVTGQQVGLFGGPVFSIYKALSAVKLAREAGKLGINCVPVFWLATEDHDLAEVDQTWIPGADRRLQTFTSGAQGKPDAPVGTVTFGPEISDVVASTSALLGESEWAKLLGECYRSGENFGSAFAKLFTRIFSEFGVILLDGSDPALDKIAAPTYRSALERSSEITHSLLDRNRELESAGYHQQVRVTDTSTLLFAMRDGMRIPIQQTNSGTFVIGEEEISRAELLRVASQSPESFSPNVLLRPVVQDYLLPTLAYVGGAAEVAYFAQAAVTYEVLLGRVSPVLPRFSATMVEIKIQALLEKNHLSATDAFQGPETLRGVIGERRLPPNLQSSFEHATAAVERSMKAVRESIAQLDKTLIESAENAESKMIYQIANLRARASRAELRHSEIVQRHAEALSNALYPEKTLQEREFAGIYFLAKYGAEWMNGLLENIHPDCLNHQIIEL
ncbi:MAG TPA: bacillithiol biosynthesis cysteine-adding enzyme BshC [Terriglobales bacterium]|nr:bacillithiol biosynthesis cysteine-adding enzyme BshC [Terriglobales bacterium]